MRVWFLSSALSQDVWKVWTKLTRWDRYRSRSSPYIQAARKDKVKRTSVSDLYSGTVELRAKKCSLLSVKRIASCFAFLA